MTPTIWLLCDDLLFASRVAGPAKDAGATVRQARDSATLLKWADGGVPALAILDLANPGLIVAELVAAMRRLTPAPTIVAFGSHVDVETLRRARDAGCDLVLPRSAFVERIGAELSSWLSRSAAPSRLTPS